MPVEAMPDEPKVAVAAAYAECSRLAKEHYENFPVGKLVPREKQKHVHAVYAFARYADDLADEGYAGSREDGRDVMTPGERLAALDDWEKQLLSVPGTPGLHPIFIALHETIRELDLPTSLFTDLLSAFRQDVVKRRYANFAEVLDYCRRSANPIGRLVLLLHEVREERLHELSDHICTALQLANFWQDVGVDLKKDRIYLPENEREQYDVTEQQLFSHETTPAYKALLKFQVARTQEIFDQGAPLTRELHGKLRVEIRLTWLGGTTILRKIEAAGLRHAQPSSEARQGGHGDAAGEGAGFVSTADATMPELPGSGEITQASKSNLALSFFSLSPEKQQAMNVFYAFCRVIDDVADSTELPMEEKRRQLGQWREEIRRAYLSDPQTPLGREMAQIIRTYLIAPSLLDDVMNGVEMDLEINRFPDFALLQKYCYGVASAVGLVSLEIFGAKHPRSREYAIALGMALQLTNILRDVRKDASFGRIYLPQSELEIFGVTEPEIMEGKWSPRMKQLLRFQALRARHYFAKAHRLMVPSDRPSLVAAEIMRAVYEGLLDKIERRGFDTITVPVKLNKFQKTWVALTARSAEKHAKSRPPAPKKIAVLGAGYAGLACAADLVMRGHEVTLLESRALLGGRAHSFVDPKTGLVLDNGQHVLMGCYHETLRLIGQLGVTGRLQKPERLDVPYLSAKGRSSLTATAPAPLHLLSALLHFGELSLADKWAATKLALRLRAGQNPGASETVGAWLRRWKQTPNIIRALWEPLCLAALNEQVETGSAMLLATVIRRSFLGGADDSSIYLSRVGLSELFGGEIEQLLTMCGSCVQLQAPVKAFRLKDGSVTGVELTDGALLEPDMVVSALPWHVLRGLLPTESKLAVSCRALGEAPIVSLHLWMDRVVLEEAFVGFLDSPVHWLFCRDLIQGRTPGHPGHVVTAVISGARETLDLSAQELEEITLREMRRFLPAAKEAQVLHRMVYKARSATFAATPEAEPLRPGALTEWNNLFLAGDWTNTGLPATIEGAIVSGRRAAAAVDAAVRA